MRVLALITVVLSLLSYSAGQKQTVMFGWGANGYGNLGDSSFSDRYSPALVTTSGKNATLFGTGGSSNHMCAVFSDAHLYCWGENYNGQLGLGNTGYNAATPQLVSNAGWNNENQTVTRIAVGQSGTAVQLQNGTMFFFGKTFNPNITTNASAPLGSPITYTRPTLYNTGNVTSAITSISVGQYHLLVVANGRVYSSGSNSFNQLGDVTNIDRPSLVSTFVPSGWTGVNVTAVAAGGLFSCALLANGNVYCWGYNLYGQLGLNTTDRSRNSPFQVVGDSGFSAQRAVRVSAGQSHACAVLANFDVYCWGSNNLGQLGDGTQTNRSYAVKVQSPDVFASANITYIRSSFNHTVVLLGNGQIWSWGSNSNGQLGVGNSSVRFSAVPVLMTYEYSPYNATLLGVCAGATFTNLVINQVVTTGIQTTGRQTTAVQTTGVQTTGVQTTDVQTTDVQTTDVQTTDVRTTHVQTTDAQTTGVQTTDVQTTDVQTTDVQTTGVQTTGVQTTGVQTTGVQTTGVQTTDVQTTDVQTTDVQTTGMQTTGMQTTDVQTTGVQTSEAAQTSDAAQSTGAVQTSDAARTSASSAQTSAAPQTTHVAQTTAAEQSTAVAQTSAAAEQVTTAGGPGASTGAVAVQTTANNDNAATTVPVATTGGGASSTGVVSVGSTGSATTEASTTAAPVAVTTGDVVMTTGGDAAAGSSGAPVVVGSTGQADASTTGLVAATTRPPAPTIIYTATAVTVLWSNTVSRKRATPLNITIQFADANVQPLVYNAVYTGLGDSINVTLPIPQNSAYYVRVLILGGGYPDAFSEPVLASVALLTTAGGSFAPPSDALSQPATVDNKLSGGAIAGIVIGSVAFVVLVVVIVGALLLRSRRRNLYMGRSATVDNVPPRHTYPDSEAAQPSRNLQTSESAGEVELGRFAV